MALVILVWGRRGEQHRLAERWWESTFSKAKKREVRHYGASTCLQNLIHDHQQECAITVKTYICPSDLSITTRL